MSSAAAPFLLSQESLDVWKRRIALIFLTGLYQSLLAWSYIFFVAPVDYNGFEFNHPAAWQQALAHAIATIPSLWLSIDASKPSRLVEWILYLVVFVPSIIFPHYIFPTDAIPLFELDAVLLTSFMIMAVVVRLKGPKISLSGLQYSSFMLLLYGLTIAFSLTIASAGGFKFHLVSLNDVYDVRSQYAAIKNASWPVGYLVPWLGNVLAPMLLSIGILQRRKRHILAALLSVLLVYSVSGFKSVLFGPLFVMMIKKTLDVGKQRTGFIFPTALSSLILCGIVIDLLVGVPLFNGFFLQRAIVFPGAITGYYYEFFRRNGFDVLSHSIFGSFLRSSFTHMPSQVIGEYYWSSYTTEANANFWASGYADFGFAGIIVFSLLLATVLWLYDSLTCNVDYRLAAMLIVLPAMTFANTPLLISLLTHGIGLLILLLLLIPRGSFGGSPGLEHRQVKTQSVHGRFLRAL